MSKTLAQLFNRFEPDDSKFRKIIDGTLVENVRINKELKFIEVDIIPDETDVCSV